MPTAWVDWAAGWVEWQAEGGAADRLLNIAREQKITVWRIRQRDIQLHACCRARRYGGLRRAARRCGMRMRVVRRHGLPFFLFRHRHRTGLLAGIALSLLLIWQLSGRIWITQVQGGTDELAGQVMQVLRPLGIRPGAPLPREGTEQIRLEAMEQLPQMSFLSIVFSGCRAQVIVRPRETPPPIDTLPVHLIAAADGVVRRVVVGSGTPLVSPGDAVRAGDLLISGIREEPHATRLLTARGEVWAETRRTYRFTVPLCERQLVPEGETIYLPQLYVFGLTIPLYGSGALPPDYAVDRREAELTARGRQLPVGIRCVRLRQPVERTVLRTEEQAGQMLRRQWSEQCAALQREKITVLHTRKQLDTQEQAVCLTVECACLENIAAPAQVLKNFGKNS